jgi:amino acid transporter
VLCGIYFILPSVLLPLFGIESTTGTRVGISLIALAVAAGVNVLSIHRLGSLTVIATVAELVVIFGITVATLIGGAHQSVSVLVDTNGTGSTFGAWLPGFLGGGVFIGLWVMQSFEVGGTIGEETIDAPRQAPRAILSGWGASFVVGLFMIVSLLIAIPDLGRITQSEQPVLDIVNGALAPWVGKLYLALLALVIILGANVIFTLVSRQIYGMARAGLMPLSEQLSRTHSRTGEPWVAVLVTAIITALPFIISDDFTVLVTGSTAVLYVVYFVMASITLAARVRGWPQETRPMRLGRWGIPVNVLAVVFTGAACVNLMWFRDTTNPDWKLGIPVAIWLLVVPLLLGAVYWALAGRAKMRRQDAAMSLLDEPAPEATVAGAAVRID